MSGLRRRALVDLGVIVSNAQALAADVELSGFSADLRADAYGHGYEPVAAALRGAGIGALEPTDGLEPLGLGLYGLDAARPAMPAALRLSGEIVALKQVPAGRGVSYGYTYRTSAPTVLALVGLGYADGVVRAASNAAPVLLGGRRARVTGRIAMDQFVVDAGAADDPAVAALAVGGEVVLFGAGERGEPTALEWAAATGIRADAIVAGLGPRVRREWIGA